MTTIILATFFVIVLLLLRNELVYNVLKRRKAFVFQENRKVLESSVDAMLMPGMLREFPEGYDRYVFALHKWRHNAFFPEEE